MLNLRSEITRKILQHFFQHPQDALYVNELGRKFNLDKRNLVKKLRELETEGILKCRMIGNVKLYSINESYALYNEYKKIINTVL